MGGFLGARRLERAGGVCAVGAGAWASPRGGAAAAEGAEQQPCEGSEEEPCDEQDVRPVHGWRGFLGFGGDLFAFGFEGIEAGFAFGEFDMELFA